MTDVVNHPPHYNSHPSGVECITITEHFNFLLGNAIKYIWRADDKGTPLQDLEKAKWYIEREIGRRRLLELEVDQEVIDFPALAEFKDAGGLATDRPVKRTFDSLEVVPDPHGWPQIGWDLSGLPYVVGGEHDPEQAPRLGDLMPDLNPAFRNSAPPEIPDDLIDFCD